jgi:hypothetical protein
MFTGCLKTYTSKRNVRKYNCEAKKRNKFWHFDYMRKISCFTKSGMTIKWQKIRNAEFVTLSLLAWTHMPFIAHLKIMTLFKWERTYDRYETSCSHTIIDKNDNKTKKGKGKVVLVHMYASGHENTRGTSKTPPNLKKKRNAVLAQNSIQYKTPDVLQNLCPRFESASHNHVLRGKGLQCLHHSSESRRKRRKGTPVLGGRSGTPCHWGTQMRIPGPLCWGLDLAV